MLQKVNKTRVLVVDDSALVRQVLSKILQSDPGIEVVGVASDPYVAREEIKRLNPDVLTLDVEMPRMDGITFLGNLMRLRPMPVVMVSSLTEQGADVTLSALELGAIDFVTKPKIDISHGLASYAAEIIDKVKAASRARVRARQDLDKSSGARRPAQQVLKHYRTTDRLIAIGASTGGTEALREVLEMMPADAPAIVITQHIPEAFSQPFARRLNSASAMSVCQAEDGQQIVQGHAYVAPGNRHLRVIRSGARYVCRLDDGEPVNRHKPSVDVMFMSVAENVGRNAVGVLLTGMGADGAQGMRAMKEAGAPTLAQDEATSVVWGMPGEAVKIGVVDHVLPLDRIAAHGLQLASR
ncbi:MAG: chemotaxis response regulator protein-glutamate methylesterase [Gammaproteobacteria bacterium]|nr:chemotaxis response regulator protein-glutamate methylesterase [Gammaproteobacteria bacterium]